MDSISFKVALPLDDSGYFRRECPLCAREFKILIEEEDLFELTKRRMDSYLLETKDADGESGTEEEAISNYCPYCGQSSTRDSWWTKEQLAYFRVFAENIIADILNENLIKPLKKSTRRSNRGCVSVSFKGEERKKGKPWISPEVNDMEVLDLPCCSSSIKILDDWGKTTHCFFCGFPHER